jgi:hypothetical protein
MHSGAPVELFRGQLGERDDVVRIQTPQRSATYRAFNTARRRRLPGMTGFDEVQGEAPHISGLQLCV